MMRAITNQKLSKTQRDVMQQIIDYGSKNGFSNSDIEIAIKTAFIESSIGNNPGPNPTSTSSGLFGYTDPNWNDNHSDDGEKNNFDNQVKAFYEDIAIYKEWYNTPETSGNIPKDQISFEEYVYIKHHDGRDYGNVPNGDRNHNGTNDFLEAPGLSTWNNQSFKPVVSPIGSDGSCNSPIDKARDSFDSAKTTVSPIILDLDGDGVETIASGDGAYFDHDGNGFAEQTGWAGADDGMLVRDLNSNGTIDTGKELFGNETLLNNGSNIFKLAV